MAAAIALAAWSSAGGYRLIFAIGLGLAAIVLAGPDDEEGAPPGDW
jgi:hypothetical protein